MSIAGKNGRRIIKGSGGSELNIEECIDCHASEIGGFYYLDKPC